MLLSKKYKCVYIAIPKTGTHSVLSVLADHFGFFEIDIVGGGIDHLSTNDGYHDDRVVSGWNSFATVRNPYTRALSLYNTYRVRNEIPLDDFLMQLACGQLPPLWNRTQTEWLRHGNADVIKMEGLEAGFNSLKWVTKHPDHPFDLPWINATAYSEVQLTEAQRRMVVDWAEDDFQAFSYRV